MERREEEAEDETKRGNRSLLLAVRSAGSFRPLFFLSQVFFLQAYTRGGNKRQITETPVM